MHAKEHEAGYKLPGLTTRKKDVGLQTASFKGNFHGMTVKRSFD